MGRHFCLVCPDRRNRAQGARRGWSRVVGAAPRGEIASWHAVVLNLRYNRDGEGLTVVRGSATPAQHAERRITPSRFELALLHMWVREPDSPRNRQGPSAVLLVVAISARRQKGYATQLSQLRFGLRSGQACQPF